MTTPVHTLAVRPIHGVIHPSFEIFADILLPRYQEYSYSISFIFLYQPVENIK